MGNCWWNKFGGVPNPNRLLGEHLMRRCVAVLFCMSLLPVLGGVAFVVWLANPMFNRGPLWFWQTRVGQGERLFRILKFRTMTVGDLQFCDTPCDTPWAGREVTPLGRILRRYHIDELPQIVNILQGDMAWFGPRPEQPMIYKNLAHSIACYRLRSLRRPGLFSTVQTHDGYIDTDGGQLRRAWLDRQDACCDRMHDHIVLLVRTVRYLLRVLKT